LIESDHRLPQSSLSVGAHRKGEIKAQLKKLMMSFEGRLKVKGGCNASTLRYTVLMQLLVGSFGPTKRPLD